MPKHCSLAFCFKDIKKSLTEVEILLVCEPNLSGSDKDSWRWSLPGGKCCSNIKKKCCAETPEETVVREYKEETGYDVIPQKTIWVEDKNNSKTKENYKQYQFVVVIKGGNSLMKKVFSEETPKWFPLKKLPRNIFRSHRQLIERFILSLVKRK